MRMIMRMRTVGDRHKRRGVTLVELVVVLALLGIIFAGAFQFLFTALNNWKRSEVQSRLYAETNVLTAWVSRDIRSAAPPNKSTKAIVNPVVTGRRQSIDIYSLNTATGHMERIRYEYAGGTIRRGWVASDEAAYPYFWNASSSTPLTKSIPAANWTNVLTGVADLDLFTFATNATTGVQTVQIVLTVNDITQPMTNPLQIDVQYSARNSGS